MNVPSRLPSFSAQAARLSCALMLSANLHAAPSPQDESFRKLVMQALETSAGSASGVVTGAFADNLRARLHSSSELRADVTTLRRFRQPGCKRLNVKWSLSDAFIRLPDGRREPFAFDTAFNLCRNGEAPLESLPDGVVATTPESTRP